MGFAVDVLIYGANGRFELSFGDSLGKLLLCRLHERAVESTSHFQFEGAFRTGGEHLLAGCVDALHSAGDHHLSGAVVVGGSHNIVDFSAKFLNLGIGKREDGGHCGGTELTSLLHGVRTFGHEFEALLEAKGAGGYKSRELAKAMAGHHIGLELIAEGFGEKHAMKEDGGLRHLRLFEVFLGAVEHQIGDAETENIVCFLKKFFCFRVVIIKIFSHSDKLGALARKYISFHIVTVVVISDFILSNGLQN